MCKNTWWGSGKENRTKFFSIMLSVRTRGNEHKLKPGKLRVNIKDNFCSRKLVEYWNKLLREIEEPLSYSKPYWTNLSSCPCFEHRCCIRQSPEGPSHLSSSMNPSFFALLSAYGKFDCRLWQIHTFIGKLNWHNNNKKISLNLNWGSWGHNTTYKLGEIYVKKCSNPKVGSHPPFSKACLPYFYHLLPSSSTPGNLLLCHFSFLTFHPALHVVSLQC